MADINKIKVGDTTYDIESKNDHTHSNKTVLDKITNKSDDKTYGIKNGDLVEIEAGGVTSYNDLTDKPIIPSKTSDLTNDSGYITIDDVPESGATSVNGKTGVVVLDAEDVGALPITGGTATGKIIVSANGVAGFESVRTVNNQEKRAGFFVNSDGTSKLVNKNGMFDSASLIFDNTGVYYALGDSGSKTTGKLMATQEYVDKHVPEVPTKTSDLTNDSGYITADDVSESGVGQAYQVNGPNSGGEIFNEYSVNIASGAYSHAEGYCIEANGFCSHAEGQCAYANGNCSHAEGDSTTASGNYSHAEGVGAVASGDYSHAEGNMTTAETYALHTQGCYNNVNTGDSSTYSATNNAFVIGNGTSLSTTSNAFRVDFSGNTYGLSAFNSTGADYAEYFEWLDGNVNNEDRIGYFVTLTDGCKIQKANATDEILGIVSGTAGVIGDSYEDTWNGMYDRDDFGRFIYEDVQVTYPQEVVNNIVIREARTVTEKHIKLNPNYDSTQEYTPRSQRKEWSCVGSMGKIYVRDDGTCQVNGKCVCNSNGIATASTNNTGWRVLERVNDSIIRVWFK